MSHVTNSDTGVDEAICHALMHGHRQMVELLTALAPSSSMSLVQLIKADPKCTLLREQNIMEALLSNGNFILDEYELRSCFFYFTH